MKIENSFIIDAQVEDAWSLLTNIPEIAPCLPGATLTDEDGGVYSGNVKIRVGPVTAEYRGSAEFVERDDTNHRAVIDGKGRDSRGAGNAQALITAALTDLGGRTQVDISTDLKVTGKVAQFGRGVMQDVSEKLLEQFAQCLATKLDGTAGALGVAERSTEPAAGSNPTTSASTPGQHVGDGAASRSADDGALDLLDVAGGAVARRVLPAVLVVLAVVVLLVLILS